MRNGARPVVQPGRYGCPKPSPGVVVSLVPPQTRVCVAVHADRIVCIESMVKQTYGLVLPSAGRFSVLGDLTCVWAGPGRWLFESDDSLLLDQLRADLGAQVSVVDQSCSSLCVDVHGARVRDVLAKGVPIDLHPTVFGVGNVALTLVSHIDVQLRQLSDEPRYRLSVSRSYFDSFWTWLTASAAEFGYQVEVPTA